MTLLIKSTYTDFFSVSQNNDVKQYSLHNLQEVTSLKKHHTKQISAMFVTSNSQFTGDVEGNFLEYIQDVSNDPYQQRFIHYGNFFSTGIESITSFKDSLQIGDNNGYIKKFNIKSKKQVEFHSDEEANSAFNIKNFEKGIRTLVICDNNLWASSVKGNVKIFDTKKGILVKDFGVMCKGTVFLELAFIDKNMFVENEKY